MLKTDESEDENSLQSAASVVDTSYPRCHFQWGID